MHGEYKVPGDFFLEPDAALDRITGAVKGLPADSSAQVIAQAVTAALLPTDTLLGFDADKMTGCLRIGREKLRDKGLRSANNRVDPMRSQTGRPRGEIIDVFVDHFTEKYSASLCERKFDREEWTKRIP